jgi:putative ABC transport system substrate-binding protein
MRRREFITLLGGVAATWPFGVYGQPQQMPVIGFLNSRSADDLPDLTAAFRQGLHEAGYVEGSNVAIEYRWAGNDPKKLPELASNLVRHQVAVIVATGGNIPAVAAKQATATIPIIFNIGDDPIKLGLVTGFNRPGGNATGMTVLSGLINPKRLELLHELVPKAKVIGALLDPANPSAETSVRDAEDAAQKVGQRIYILKATNESEIEAAFGMLSQVGAEALLVLTDAIFIGLHKRIVGLAALHAVPAIYDFKFYSLAGGLVSYGPIAQDAYRQVGTYTGRVLKGEKPADLPVIQPTKFELVINLKTAKALGLTVPSSILARADEVIE